MFWQTVEDFDFENNLRIPNLSLPCDSFTLLVLFTILVVA